MLQNIILEFTILDNNTIFGLKFFYFVSDWNEIMQNIELLF